MRLQLGFSRRMTHKIGNRHGRQRGDLCRFRVDTGLQLVFCRRMTLKIILWFGLIKLVGQGSNGYSRQRGERCKFSLYTGLQLGGSGRRESWPQMWLLCTLCYMLHTDMLYAICYTQICYMLYTDVVTLVSDKRQRSRAGTSANCYSPHFCTF